jgi:hypothetical protein
MGIKMIKVLKITKVSKVDMMHLARGLGHKCNQLHFSINFL